ncbi:ZZ-type zinc finger-containing protein 3-like [Augochlora pura]
MEDEEEIKCQDEEPGEFYFESDHLALKGNKDYTTLLKTIVILEAQRVQAIEDLDKLLSIRSKALKDPISFVAQIQNGELPELPGPQKIAEIPYIDWSQYNIAVPDMRIRPQTRHGHVLPHVQTKTEQENGKILVRGRAFDESKPETFNQLWTVEEQKRLEELLIEYPPEEVEMRRWTKIANALGNRTPKQVSSRVQKYFIKLLRAGLPIPGRGPKMKLDAKKGIGHRHQRGCSKIMCALCGDEPLTGTRWHCIECQDEVDLCSDCAVAQLEAEKPSHDPLHRLIPIKPPQYTRNYDLDYFPQSFSNSSYNYLDPNFLPE